MTVSNTFGEGVACNTIFSCPFLQTIKASIMTENNTLVSDLLVDQFKLETMVTQISKKAPKTSDGLIFSLPVTIP